MNPDKKQWIEDALAYIDKYAEKCVIQTVDGMTVYGYKEVALRLLENALNGNK